jgi:hypothetical protein
MKPVMLATDGPNERRMSAHLGNYPMQGSGNSRKTKGFAPDLMSA